VIDQRPNAAQRVRRGIDEFQTGAVQSALSFGLAPYRARFDLNMLLVAAIVDDLEPGRPLVTGHVHSSFMPPRPMSATSPSTVPVLSS
jgi:hypothetical protein